MGSVGNRLSDLDTDFAEALYISQYSSSTANPVDDGGGDSSEDDDSEVSHDSQLFQVMQYS